MDSALSGGPDTELLDGGSRPAWVDQMFAVMSRPLARDGDAGGKPDHFAHAVQMMERKGVSAVVIDDQCGDKRHSLLPESGLHTLAPIDDVCGKSSRGKEAQSPDEFMIFAHLEGLTTGIGAEEVLERASNYVKAGADGLVVHSRSSEEAVVTDVIRELRSRHPEIPLVAISSPYRAVSLESPPARYCCSYTIPVTRSGGELPVVVEHHCSTAVTGCVSSETSAP